MASPVRSRSREAPRAEPHPLRLGRFRLHAPPPGAGWGRRDPAPDSAPPPPFPILRFEPPPHPLPMPRQDLREAPAARPLEGGLVHRRLILVLGALAIALLDGAVLLDAFKDHGLTAAEFMTILLSTLLGGWVGFGFVSAVAGFVASWGDRHEARAPPLAWPRSAARTALLAPAYNEDPGLVFAAVEAVAEDLERLGIAAGYDIFVLSDTRDEAIARAEAAAYLRVRLRLRASARIHYRRRADNADRKAGNVAEWVARHGGGFDYMVVLDADSLLTGEALRELTGRMDADPRLGLLQTVPTIINAQTPFARLQQFASRLYGPVYARGQQWWSGGEGNYWGHNAIIRVAAFAESAGLPHLPGPRPWGGHIMSHDFIEAGLLRRRGWAVRTVAELGGSHEEAPPTLLDTAVRDRRWCQGNLQHARLLSARGLHWVSRLHLVMGILAYLASPLWLGLLICGEVAWSSEHLARGTREYGEVADVLGVTLGLLAIPKLLALVLALRAPRLRQGFGGAGRLVAGVLLETFASLLITPVMMLMQSVAIVDVAIGRDSGWKPQRREGAEISPKDVWRAHRVHVALGVLGAAGALVLNRYLLVWAGPVFLSLALSSLLSLHTSRPSAGKAGTPRLLRTPEDVAPPPVLVRARALRAAYAAEAGLRRAIDLLFRDTPPVYEFGAPRVTPIRRWAA